MREFLILLTLISICFSAQCQNDNTKYIGELNPSLNMAGTFSQNSGYNVLDFDDKILILLKKHYREDDYIAIVDLSKKTFGKFSIIDKINVSGAKIQDLSNIKIHRFENSSKRVIQIEDSDIYYVVVDYNEKSMYTIKPERYINYKRKRSLTLSKKVFLDKDDNLVLGYSIKTYAPGTKTMAPGHKELIDTDMHYQTYDAQNNKINVSNKNKGLKEEICFYYRDFDYSRNELNEDCAFQDKKISARARKPISKSDTNIYGDKVNEKLVENQNSVFIDFYRGKYIDNKRDESFLYTYEFKCEKERVRFAYISSDLQFVLVNNKFIYKIPTIEIQE